MHGREYRTGFSAIFIKGKSMKNNRFVACVLIPSVIFLLIFAVFPVAYGLGISFYDYNPTSSYNEFLGLENYKRLLTDEVFWIAVKNTIIFV